MLKRKLWLSLLLMLVFVGNANALDGSTHTTLVNSNVLNDTENTLSWPAIPGENLNEMARAFYPDNHAMRRLFIARTLQLNPAIAPALKSSVAFKQPILITIPTLKDLSSSKQASSSPKNIQPNRQLNMSLNLSDVVSKIPALLLQEYELLLSKNTFLKAEVERLHSKINNLQIQLSNIKLVLDKTLSLPNQSEALDENSTIQNASIQHVGSQYVASQHSVSQNAPQDLAENGQSQSIQLEVKQPESQQPDKTPAKRLFKNLDENSTNAVNTSAKQVKPLMHQSQTAFVQSVATPEKASESSSLLHYILLSILSLSALLALIIYSLKQNRERRLTRLNESMLMMGDTSSDFSGNWKDTDQIAESNLGSDLGSDLALDLENAAQAEYVAQHPLAPANHFMNTQMLDEQAKANASLEEAKLLISVNRTQDAIDHLKLTIETQPKTSINHWLYLLEIFRKLQLKQEFEVYAQSLHRTFNVMTPVWYETNIAANAAIVVPQKLEDFAHIMAKLDTVWPSDLAKAYLYSLLTDNRDGERAGFSQAVLDEILMLIALLDTRKALT